MEKTKVRLFGKVFLQEDAVKEVEHQTERLQKYKECFNTEAGQFVLADLMIQASKPSYVMGSPMPFQDVTFNLGVKSVVDEIVNTVEFNEETLERLNEIKKELLNYERRQQFNANSGTVSTKPSNLL
jgi:hypothetical protein